MLKLFQCERCGNIATLVKDSGVPLVCCGKPMVLLVPNTVDAAVEKHTPVISAEGSVVTVDVGSAPHPMTEEHLIDWVILVTQHGVQRAIMAATDEPKAVFHLCPCDSPVVAYAYCNLHGVWQADA